MDAHLLDAVISMQATRLLEEHYASLLLENDLLRATHVLDLICGPGTWSLDVARQYPHVRVTGIDSRPTMIQYAQAQRWAAQCQNVDFQLVQDPLQLTLFPLASFDVVNTFFNVDSMLRNDWSRVVQESFRVLRPHGVLSVVEIGGWDICEAPAVSHLLHIFHQAMWKAERSFSKSGGLGIAPKVQRLLHLQGFESVTLWPLILDGSYGAEAHDLLLQHFMVLLIEVKPLLLTLLSEKEFQQLFLRARYEMRQEGFGGFCYGAHLRGRRPVL